MKKLIIILAILSAILSTATVCFYVKVSTLENRIAALEEITTFRMVPAK